MAFSDIASTTAPEQFISSAASRYGMGGGMLTSLLGYFTSNGGAILVGILVTFAGFLVTVYYQRKRDYRETHEMTLREEFQLAEEERKQELHEAKLEALRSGIIDTV